MWPFKKKKLRVDPEKEKHCYTNWKNVMEHVTTVYGFEYGGVGDNGEECFYGGTKEYPERLWIHPMFIHFYRAGSGDIHAKRGNIFYKETKFDDTKAQLDVFFELCNHLNCLYNMKKHYDAENAGGHVPIEMLRKVTHKLPDEPGMYITNFGSLEFDGNTFKMNGERRFPTVVDWWLLPIKP